MDALLLIAFGRSAAFAAAPERADMLRRAAAQQAGSSSNPRGGGPVPLGADAPLQLESWAGALEAESPI